MGDVQMYMSIRHYDGIDASKIDELISVVISGFLPIISKAPKFVSYQAIDCGNGEVAAITVFEDNASLEESNQLAADWVRDNIAHLIVNPPKITAGNVLYTYDSLGHIS